MACLIYPADSDPGENLELSLRYIEASSRAIQGDATDAGDAAILAHFQEIVCRSMRNLLTSEGLA